MARSHKDRHKWKRKEIKRTGKSDPTKIKLHRQRFLKKLELKSVCEKGYKPIVFQSHLFYSVTSGITLLTIEGKKIGEIPFIVEKPNACHYLICNSKRDFDVGTEQQVLAEHVNKVKFLKESCHLVVVEGGQRLCSAIVGCPYRKWQGLPVCSL